MILARFNVTKENDDGTFYLTTENITFPKNGFWNLDISSVSFDKYLTQFDHIKVQMLCMGFEPGTAGGW